MTDWASPATIRERQKAAALVLLDLLTLDLPAPNWDLTCIHLVGADQAPRLVGQLGGPHYETPETVEAAIDAWAVHFGTTPYRRESTSSFLEVKAVINGVQVRVWGISPAPKKAHKLAAVAS